MWLRSFVPRHDLWAAGCSCPSTCLLATPACPWLQPSHTVQSIKLQYKNKLKKSLFCLVFLALCSASHVISPCLSQTKPADDASHFLPLSVLEFLFCLCGDAADRRALTPRLSLHTSWDPAHSSTPARNASHKAGRTRKTKRCWPLGSAVRSCDLQVPQLDFGEGGASF